MQPFFTALGGNMNLLDPQGLAANRTGEMTDAQNKRLNLMLGLGQGCGMIIPLLVLGFMGFFLFSFSLTFDIRSDGLFALFPFLVIGLVILGLLAAAGPQAWKLVDNGIKLKRDRDNRAIRQGQGGVAFDKKGYVFKIAERNLVLPSPENTGGLLPGATYRVYYLEETGFLLSAEEAYPASPAQVRQSLRDILAQANNFSLEDLTHNSSGEITSAQRMKPLGQVVMGGIFGVVALVFGGIFFFQVFPNLDAGDALPAIVIPALVLGIFALVGGWMFLNGLLDMSISSIEQVEGPGHKEKRTSGGRNRSTRYYYVINGQSFQVNRRAYTALIDGLAYRVYYLPRTKKLVSIEPVDVTPGSSQYNLNN
jgi:hypothetical protein